MTTRHKKINRIRKYLFKIISSKIDVIDIITGHYESLENYKTKNKMKDLSTFFGIPLIFSVIVVLLCGGRLNSEASTSILYALSIFTPVMFTLLVSIYSINRKRLTKKKIYIIIKEFKNNVSFIIILCLFSLFIIIISSLQMSIPLAGFEWLYNIVYSIIIIYLLGIIGLTLLQVLKRWNALLDSMLQDIKPDNEKFY